MSFIDKLLALAVLAVAVIIFGLLLLNRDAAQATGQHIERFTAEALQLALYCMSGAIVLAALAGAVVLWALVAKRRNENLRQRDGSFPLQRVRVPGAYIYIDPNKIIGAALGVSANGVAELFSTDPQLHLQHAIERAKVAQLQALAPGDAAISSRDGSMYRPGSVFNAATGKHLAGGWDRPPRQLPPPRIIGGETDDVPRPSPPGTPRLTLSQALSQATPTALLAGQSDAGDTAIFDPLSNIHCGIIGATGTGKTSSVGYSLVAQALRTGYHVAILDPKGGADWKPWSSHAEWHASDYQTFPAQVDALWAEHERRTAILQSAGARSIDDDALAGAIPHSLIVVEEYGDLIAQLRRANRKRADATDATLDRLMRLSRVSGLHLLMIDQYPQEWSHQVFANAKLLLIFRLGPGQGNKVGEYHAEKLPDHGRFIVRGKEYNAWFAAPHLDKLLAVTPRSQTPRIIDAAYTVRRSPADGGEGSTSGEQVTNSPANTVANSATNTPTDADGWYEWMLASYAPLHPELLTTDDRGRGVGVTALAQDMAKLARGDAGQFAAYKGIASEIAQRLRAEWRVPDPDAKRRRS